MLHPFNFSFFNWKYLKIFIITIYVLWKTRKNCAVLTAYYYKAIQILIDIGEQITRNYSLKH